MQHYWSLSVEEQFHLCWPLLVAGLVLLALRAGVRRAAVVRAGLGVVIVASLAYSVHATAVEPASAYFVTPARVWELGVGALLAVLLADRAGEQRPFRPAGAPRWPQRDWWRSSWPVRRTAAPHRSPAGRRPCRSAVRLP